MNDSEVNEADKTSYESETGGISYTSERKVNASLKHERRGRFDRRRTPYFRSRR
jgi:hypothetical protein